MKTILVREIYTVDTISKTNDKAWEVLMGVLKDSDEDILFDFNGIEVVEPWANDTFKKFLGYENAYMKLYSSQQTVNTINLACRVNGIKADRFFNESVAAPVTLSNEEKQIKAMAIQLQDYFIEEDGTAVFEVHKRFDQIGSVNTVDYIERAIQMYCDEHNIKNCIVNTADIFIQKNILELLANMIGRYYTNGLNVNIASTDKDVINKIGLYQHLASANSLTAEDKYNIAKSNLVINMVGMLTKYKRSKAVDEFGRHGNGEAVSCRVAIFNGFAKNGSGTICLKFTTYNGNSFFTKEHWSLENDGDSLDGLESDKIIIPITEIGILDKYIGSKYHFMEPIQHDNDGYTTMYSINESGSAVSNNLTIPMRIKVVLDDWGIEYVESSLVHAIAETERLLDKANNSK